MHGDLGLWALAVLRHTQSMMISVQTVPKTQQLRMHMYAHRDLAVVSIYIGDGCKVPTALQRTDRHKAQSSLYGYPQLPLTVRRITPAPGYYYALRFFLSPIGVCPSRLDRVPQRETKLTRKEGSNPKSNGHVSSASRAPKHSLCPSHSRDFIWRYRLPLCVVYVVETVYYRHSLAPFGSNAPSTVFDIKCCTGPVASAVHGTNNSGFRK